MAVTLSGETRLYPIIGKPIIHAKSPERLSANFARRGRNAVCIPMEVPDSQLPAVMEGLAQTQNVDGILVTMPHKFAVFPFCKTVSPTSRMLGGVSVIRRSRDGSWHGDNQDGLSFVKAQIDHGARPEGARVLLVGAGAAGGAIAIALLDAGIRELIVHDSVPERVTKLIDVISGISRGRVRAGPPDPTGCDMVCNATPMGFNADDPLPIPAHLLAPSMFVGDVIASHGVTPLLQAAQAVGCKTADGVQMVEAVQEMMLDYMLGA